MVKLLQKDAMKLNKGVRRWREVGVEDVERMREAPEGEGGRRGGGVYI